MAATIVPAAGPLAQVAANRTHVADLRAGDSSRGRRQRWKAFANVSVLEQLVQRDDRADAETRFGVLNPAQLFDVLNVDDALGRGEVLLHETDEIGAAGENIRLAPACAEQTHRLLYR